MNEVVAPRQTKARIAVSPVAAPFAVEEHDVLAYPRLVAQVEDLGGRQTELSPRPIVLPQRIMSEVFEMAEVFGPLDADAVSW